MTEKLNIQPFTVRQIADCVEAVLTLIVDVQLQAGQSELLVPMASKIQG